MNTVHDTVSWNSKKLRACANSVNQVIFFSLGMRLMLRIRPHHGMSTRHLSVCSSHIYALLACMEYDRLFRLAASRDTSIHWDDPKADIFVRALTLTTHTHPSRAVTLPSTSQFSQQSSRDKDSWVHTTGAHLPPVLDLPHPPVDLSQTMSSMSHTMPSAAKICHRYNLGKCARDERHQGKGCPKRQG